MKYRNHKVSFEGETFDSKKEYERYLFLRAKLSSGEIFNLERQVSYELLPTQWKPIEVQLKTKTKTTWRIAERACNYTCDFRYELPDGRVIVEDVKIGNTKEQSRRLCPKEYILKRKMMLYFHKINISEVYTATQPIS